MMKMNRRELLKALAAIAAAHKLRALGGTALAEALAGQTKPSVVWLQGTGCNGDSVSLLNSIYYAPIDDILINTVDLQYHPTVMAAAGDLAVSAAETTRLAGGYVLVIEGGIPTGGNGKYCQIWDGMTMQNAVQTYSQNAAFILAVGSCAAFGGVTAGTPNPTQSTGVVGLLGNLSKIINIPGCPAHPDWVVGTIAYLLENGQVPPLDASRRPQMFFGKRIHDYCHERHDHCGADNDATALGQRGCLEDLGCKGPRSYADCYSRKFNSGQAAAFGVNWCVGARSPCIGCVQPDFPDGMSPFFT